MACATLSGACFSTEDWTTTQELKLPVEVVRHRGSSLVAVVSGMTLQVWRHPADERWKGPYSNPNNTTTWSARELDVRTCKAGPAREYKEDPLAPGGPLFPGATSASFVFGTVEYYADPKQPESLMALDRTTGQRSTVARNLGVLYSMTPVPEARRIVIVVNGSSAIRVFDVDTERVLRCL